MSIEKQQHSAQIIETEKNSPAGEKFPKPEAYLKLMKESGFPEHANAYEKVLNCARAVKENGGRALLAAQKT